MRLGLKILFLLMGVFTLTGVLFYYKYPFWNHYKTDNFSVLTTYESSHIKGYHGKQVLIHKDFEKYMNQIDELAARWGIEVHIIHAYRCNQHTLTNTIVEPAKYSNHEAGHAIDFNLKYKDSFYKSTQLFKRNLKNQPQPIQDFIQSIRNHELLRWGGDFGVEDPTHIDFPLNITDKNKWNKNEKECEADYSKRIPQWQFWR